MDKITSKDKKGYNLRRNRHTTNKQTYERNSGTFYFLTLDYKLCLKCSLRVTPLRLLKWRVRKIRGIALNIRESEVRLNSIKILRTTYCSCPTENYIYIN